MNLRAFSVTTCTLLGFVQWGAMNTLLDKYGVIFTCSHLHVRSLSCSVQLGLGLVYHGKYNNYHHFTTFKLASFQLFRRM